MHRRGQRLTGVACAVLTAYVALGQSQPETPHFEVISVKPVTFSPVRTGCTGDRFAFGGLPLTRLIQWAYDLPPTRIQGLPNWITDWVNKTDSMFEIEAKASAAVNEAQCKAMVRSLLADRFRMVARVQEREIRVYALTVAKKGLKMREVSPGTTGAGVRINGTQWRSVGIVNPLPGVSMADLALRLSAVPIVGLPVIDRTGLTGIYSFDLSFWAREGDDRPAISTALQEQLGLKLEPIKSPIEVLVVDHIEKPSPN